MNHRWSRDFSVAQGTSLVPVGKTFRRRGLLHILIYFTEGILPCPFTNPPMAIDAADTVQERSTCFSMETGYLPVTFCGKISSGADPVAFVRASVEKIVGVPDAWLPARVAAAYRVSKEKIDPDFSILVFGYLFRALRGILI